MKDTYYWGILGPGKIAHKFAQGLSHTGKAKLKAIGSRNYERARSFADQYQAEKAFGSYEELAMDKEVDIIYIATPHHLHFEMTKLCLENGKHVLCEKPASINSRQFKELSELAREKQLFYMDALWTRFLPAIEKSLELLPLIGEIKSIRADFGFKAPYDENSRIFNPDFGGGTVLDIGIYTIFISLLFLGKPEKIFADAIIGKTGVDETSSCIFKYKSGAIATLTSTFLSDTKTEAEIAGEKGSITFLPKFFMTSGIEFRQEGKKTENFSFVHLKNGYEYEAIELMDCLDKGWIQSKKLPHSFTLDLMEIMDEIRKQIGVRYAQDF